MTKADVSTTIGSLVSDAKEAAVICAHTIRKLKPGTFDQFAEAFRAELSTPPAGMVRFTMLRSLSNRDEVVTFGHFTGTLADLNELQSERDYPALVTRIAPFVDSVVANGVYEVVQEENL